MKYFIIFSLYIALNFGQTWNTVDLPATSIDFFKTRVHNFASNGKIVRRTTSSGFDTYITTYSNSWNSYETTTNGSFGSVYDGLASNRYDYGYNSYFFIDGDDQVIITAGNNNISETRFTGDTVLYYNHDVSEFKNYSSSAAHLQNGDILLCGHLNSDLNGDYYDQSGIVVQLTPQSLTEPNVNYPFSSIKSEILHEGYADRYLGLVDMPVSIFNENQNVYIITLQKYIGSSGGYDSLGMGLKLWKMGTTVNDWTKIYEWTESDRVLEVQTLNNRKYVLVESTDRNSSDKGIYKIYRGVVNKVNTNWADSLYIVGMTATTNDLIASVSSQTQDGEIIIVNSFDTTTAWTAGSGSIGGIIYNGTANYNNSSIYLRATAGSEEGKLYEIKFTISDYTAGNIKVRLGNTTSTGVVSDAITGNGEKTIYLTQTADRSYFYFQPTSYTGKIDNLTIREFAGNPEAKIDKLYKYVNGKWTFMCNQLFASNNVVRVGNRLWFWYYNDRWGFTHCANGATDYVDKLYYTDNVPATTQPELNNYFIGIGINK